VVSIFTRALTDDLASLVKKIDKSVKKNDEKKMAALVVLLSDDPDTDAKRLEKFAKRHKIENVPLTTFDGPEGPPSYKISKDAEVTVMMWRNQVIASIDAFKKDRLDKKAVRKLVKGVQKILKSKKEKEEEKEK